MNLDTVTKLLLWGLGVFVSCTIGINGYFLVRFVDQIDQYNKITNQNTDQLIQMDAKVDNIVAELSEVKLELRGVKNRLHMGLLKNDANRLQPAQLQWPMGESLHEKIIYRLDCASDPRNQFSSLCGYRSARR